MSTTREAAEGDSPPVELRRRIEFFLVLGGIAAMGPMSLDMSSPALPTVGRDLHVNTSAVLLTVSVYLLGLAVGQAVGPLSDVFGRRRPLLLGVALFTAASLVVGPEASGLPAARTAASS